MVFESWLYIQKQEIPPIGAHVCSPGLFLSNLTQINKLTAQQAAFELRFYAN